jgi:hypothetical protein
VIAVVNVRPASRPNASPRVTRAGTPWRTC